MASRFDAALKDYFFKLRPELLESFPGGVPVVEYLNVELPKIRERRVDLLLRLADESLLHVEFQSTNLWDMPEADEIRFRYALHDIREWSANDLLASRDPANHILAILAGTDDPPAVVRQLARGLRDCAVSRQN